MEFVHYLLGDDLAAAGFVILNLILMKVFYLSTMQRFWQQWLWTCPNIKDQER